MKERPILFSAPMVKSILDGRKTQTRRVMKGIDPDRLTETMTKSHWAKVHKELPDHFGARYFCPYGQPGDRLWVRESWYQDGCWEKVSQPEQPWEGDTEWRGRKDIRYAADDPRPAGWRSRPSIHMPRWASRITLEIVSVRVERLQDISEGDAKAEGCDEDWHKPISTPNDPGEWNGTSAIDDYATLWESINGPGSWDANPWVWVVDFRRVVA